jgi:hypothetical protein
MKNLVKISVTGFVFGVFATVGQIAMMKVHRSPVKLRIVKEDVR